MSRIRLLVAGLAALALATPLALTSASMASAVTCYDYEFIAARGSGEEPGLTDSASYEQSTTKGMGAAVFDEFSRLQVALAARGRSLKGWGVRYPAVDVFGKDLLAGATKAVHIVPSGYDDSVAKGAVSAAQELRATRSACPTTRFLVSGYSQGADTIAAAVRSLTFAERQTIVANALFGDPQFNPSDDPADKGDYDPGHYGMLYNRALWSTWLSAPTFSYCHYADIVCNLSKPIGSLPVGFRDLPFVFNYANSHGGDPGGQHTNYLSAGDTARAADAIMNVIARRVVTNNSVTPTIEPLDFVYIIDTTSQTSTEYPWLQNIRSQADVMFDEASKQSVDTRVAVVSFKGTGAGNDYVTRVDSAFTSSRQTVISAISSLTSSGGTPTTTGRPVGAGLSAVNTALGLNWRPNARRVIVDFSSTRINDITPGLAGSDKTEQGTGLQVTDVAASLQQAGVRLYSMIDTQRTNSDVEGWQQTLGWSSGGFASKGGSTSFPDAINFVYFHPRPMIASATAATAGDTIKFSARGSLLPNPDDMVNGWTWSISGGTGVTSSGGSTSLLTAKFSNPGTYEVRLDESTKKGQQSARPNYQTIVVSPAPTAKPSAPSSATTTQSGTTATVKWTASSNTSARWATIKNDRGQTVDVLGLQPTATSGGVSSYQSTLTGLSSTDARGFTVSLSNSLGDSLATFASDSFSRTVASGLGSADSGGAWSVSSGVAADFAVDGSAAQLKTTPGQTKTVDLKGAASSDSRAALVAGFPALPVGGSAYVLVDARKATSDGYRCRFGLSAAGKMTIQFQRVSGSTSIGSSFAVPSVTVVNGDRYNLACSARGTTPTSLRAKVWKVGTTEPVAWATSASDATAALQTTGWSGFGLSADSAVTKSPYGVSIDDFALTPNSDSTNVAPVAIPSLSVNGRTLTFDASGSRDEDGAVKSYKWTFGDGTSSTSSVGTHAYSSSGTFSTTLVATDDGGAQSSTATVSIKVSQAPSAVISQSIASSTAHLSATGSTDPDGTIASYGWDFGDGTAGAGATLDHVYDSPGTYTVRLTTVDNDGNAASSTSSVKVNKAPVADFGESADGLTAYFDGTYSSDADGSIVAWQWNFGDGTNATESAPVHVYAAAGDFLVSLTVTDSDGATSTVARNVHINAPPKAVIASTQSARTVNFDGSGSSDPDGSITQYYWSFGDSSSDFTMSPQHTYRTGGIYTVQLQVSDDVSNRNTATKTVVIPYSSDSFTRSQAAGLGDSDAGGTWSVSGGAPDDFSVDGTSAQIRTSAGQTRLAELAASSARDVRAESTIALGALPLDGADYVSLDVRKSTTDGYRCRFAVSPAGQVTIQLLQINGAASIGNPVVVPNFTLMPSTRYNAACSAVGNGTTSLSAKIWKLGTMEPSAWTITAIDSTPSLQVAGWSGLAWGADTSVTNGSAPLLVDDFVYGPAT